MVVGDEKPALSSKINTYPVAPAIYDQLNVAPNQSMLIAASSGSTLVGAGGAPATVLNVKGVAQGELPAALRPRARQ